MLNRVRPPHLPVPAQRKACLIDFSTGKADLQIEHKAWLDETLGFVRPSSNFWIHIYGFASKLARHGSRNAEEARRSNVELSFERASEVARYIERKDQRVTTRIAEFSARGSDSYTASAGDDSPEQRAVEVHVHIATAPPPPAPEVERLPPLPGGRRFAQWSIAVPFGVTYTPLPGAALAANVVVFRCDEDRGATHVYLAPGTGPGMSYSGPSLTKIKGLIKELLGSASYTGMSFTPTAALTPFNFRDLDGASCLIEQAGIGIGVGYLAARVSVSGKVWYREQNRKPFFATRDFVKNVDASGKDLQLGLGAAAIGGPLIRLD